jgi:hypothetical protein
MFNVLLIVVCPFVLFILIIGLSILLRYTDSDYPFGVFNLFLRSHGIGRGDNMVSHYNAVWFGAAVYNGVCWNPAERIRNMSAENRTPNTLEFNVRTFI